VNEKKICKKKFALDARSHVAGEFENKIFFFKNKKKSALDILSHVTYRFQKKCASDTLGLVGMNESCHTYE